MHRTLSSFRLLIPCLLLGLALGCRSGGASPSTDDTNTATTIDIENHDFNDMTVYVLVNGARTRLGIASGHQTTVLTIPRYLVNGTTYLRFFADPIGGHRTPVSEEIDVSTGDALVMVINPGG